MFLGWTNAPLALLICICTTLLVNYTIPRYVKVISFVLSAFTLRTFVLPFCTFRPTCEEIVASSLHLLMAMGQQCQVVCKVQVFKLHPQGPPDSISFLFYKCMSS